MTKKVEMLDKIGIRKLAKDHGNSIVRATAQAIIDGKECVDVPADTPIDYYDWQLDYADTLPLPTDFPSLPAGHPDLGRLRLEYLASIDFKTPQAQQFLLGWEYCFNYIRNKI